MNNLCATGRIGKDCESRTAPNGDPFTVFPLAMDSGYGEKKVTTWLNCTFWGKRGEAVAPYLKKGGQVAINGELTNREYTDKEGNKRFSLDLRVNDLTLLGGKNADSGINADTYNQQSRPAKRQPGEDDDTGSDDIPF